MGTVVSCIIAHLGANERMNLHTVIKTRKIAFSFLLAGNKVMSQHMRFTLDGNDFVQVFATVT